MAAAAVPVERLARPVYVVVTADEEVTGRGAVHVAERSRLYRGGPTLGVITEPTRLLPVYAHKASSLAVVTAHGRAAHSSTGKGINATLLMAPFLAEIALLAEEIKRDESFLNHEFTPRTTVSTSPSMTAVRVPT